MTSLSLRHFIVTSIVINIGLAMIILPNPLFAQGPVFGGKITRTVDVSAAQPACRRTYTYVSKSSSGTICEGAGIISSRQYCRIGGYMIGFGSGTIVRAWCGRGK